MTILVLLVIDGTQYGIWIDQIGPSLDLEQQAAQPTVVTSAVIGLLSIGLVIGGLTIGFTIARGERPQPSNPPRLRSRILPGALAAAGVILLIAWIYSVTAYGFEVDDGGLTAELRPHDIALFTGGTTMLTAAMTIAIAQRRHASHQERL